MSNIAILCSGGDDMPLASEQPHLLMDNTEINVMHRKQNMRLICKA